MADNPLVAAPVDTATPFSGTGLLDDGVQLTQAIQSGDWVAGGMAAFGTAMDLVAAASDPLGSLIAAGLGWLMDHLEPLKGWLNDLTGDAGEVQAFSQTWSNISQQLTMSGQELARIVGDLDTQAGETVEAYRRLQADAGKHIGMAGQLAGAFSTGLGIASTIVQVVHDLVRDAISQIVGSAISWAAEAVFSLGLATPWIIEQVSTRVSSLVGKIGGKLTDLLKSAKQLKTLLSKADEILSKLKGILDKVFRKSTPLPGGTTMRGYELPTELSAASRRQLEAMAKESPPRVTKLPDGSYQLSDPVTLGFQRTNPHHDPIEFDRQISHQQEGLNQLSVDEWRHNVDDYQIRGRMGAAEQAQARIDLGGQPGDGRAVLHNPDQIAGGRPDELHELGDARINSSLGRQWQDQIDPLTTTMRDRIQGIPDELLPHIRMNVRLR